MAAAKLVLLEPKHAQAFLRFYQDFVQHDPINSEFYRLGQQDFLAFVQQMQDEAEGRIPADVDKVPCHHYWLMTEQGDLVAAIRLRHHIEHPILNHEGGHIGYDVAPCFRRHGYGTLALRALLPQAWARGLDRVLVTADHDNVASRRIIEANGGVFESMVYAEHYQNQVARYWICAPRS